jgi:peptidoglycan hydrolase-like protein with peptidoglycan-binding domain
MRLTGFVFAVAAAAATSAFGTDGTFVDSSTLRAVQQTLTQRGFETLRADGIMGPRTQAALRAFQRSERLEATGQLNRQTLIALGIERPHASAAASEPAYRPAVMRKAQQTLNDRGFKAGAVSGTLTAATQTAIRKFQKSENLEETGRLNDRTLAALGIDPESASQAARRTATPAAMSVRDLQHRLNMLGYDAGAEDGVMGRETRAALMEFQRAHNLRVTGRMDGDTLVALRVDGNVASR